MFLFIDFSILGYMYWASEEDKANGAGLAVMVRYSLLLADYVYFFTRSLANSRDLAVSIERIRKYA